MSTANCHPAPPGKSRFLMQLTSAALLLLLLPLQVPAQTARELETAADPALDRLETELIRLTLPVGGTVGFTAIHVESGRRVALNPKARFPLASAYKIAIAAKALHRVDNGELSLDQMITFQPSDMRPGSGTLTSLFIAPGVAVSVRNLLELTMLISDNSASDMLLRLAGGPEAVTARLRQLGIRDFDVNGPTAAMIARSSGIRTLPPEEQWSPELFALLEAQVPAREAQQARLRMADDLLDSATPEAMAELLLRLHQGAALSSESTALLLDIMRRSRTGQARIPGILPSGTVTAHKTGTLSCCTNDAGILTLPHGAGHVVLAAFIRGSAEPQAVRERAIAECARAVHDFFVFFPHLP
jgi:beta-lactamase class A